MPERVVTVIVPGTVNSIVTLLPDLAGISNVALSAGCSPINGIIYSITGRVSGKSDVLGQSLSFVR